MDNSTVIITGAHGFIGRHCAKVFERAGWRVVGVDHTPWQKGDPADWGIAQWHVASVTTDVLTSLKVDPDVVVHCAGSGSVGFSYTEPGKDFKFTVESTSNILEFIRLHAPNVVFVIPSSAAVYGVAKELPTPTNHPTNPVSHYGVHKLMTEMLCRSYNLNFGLTAVIIRFFSVFGEGQRKLLLWDACQKIINGEGEFFGTGDETRDFLHVGDAAELIRLASSKAERGQINVINGGTGKSVTVRAIIEELVQLLNCELIPEFNGQTRTGDPLHYLADISDARDWGWKPSIKLKDGLRRYVDWWQRVDGSRTSLP
jgi:UDP-glucose 4-epimerase